MRKLIKKILKESEDEFGWVDINEPELIRDDEHRHDIIENVISKVKEYNGWGIKKESFDGVVYWWGGYSENGNYGYTGMATPEWSEPFEIPVDISYGDDYDNVTVIRTPKFKYVIEVEDWYKKNYFQLVDKVLKNYMDGDDVPGLIEF
jgi:hypothetical protein